MPGDEHGAGAMPSKDETMKGPFYMVSIEKVLMLPDGRPTFQSFTGLLTEEQIRQGVGALVLDVIDNYPPCERTDARPATKSEAEDAMLQEISSKTMFNDGDGDETEERTKH